MVGANSTDLEPNSTISSYPREEKLEGATRTVYSTTTAIWN